MLTDTFYTFQYIHNNSRDIVFKACFILVEPKYNFEV